MKYLALLATLLAAPLFAQDAKIMIVEKPDSQKLAKAYREYKDALKHWEDIKEEVAKQYTSEKGRTIAGWEKIQFSADFRAIVPDSSQYAYRPTWGSGCVFSTGVNAVGSSNLVIGSNEISSTTITGDAFSSPYYSSIPLADLAVKPDLIVKEKPKQ